MHTNVVFLDLIFAAEHKEIVSVLWYAVGDLVGQACLVEICIAATKFAESVWIEGKTEDEACCVDNCAGNFILIWNV